jgi:hypothetical protein
MLAAPLPVPMTLSRPVLRQALDAGLGGVSATITHAGKSAAAFAVGINEKLAVTDAAQVCACACGLTNAVPPCGL